MLDAHVCIMRMLPVRSMQALRMLEYAAKQRAMHQVASFHAWTAV